MGRKDSKMYLPFMAAVVCWAKGGSWVLRGKRGVEDDGRKQARSECELAGRGSVQKLMQRQRREMSRRRDGEEKWLNGRRALR